MYLVLDGRVSWRCTVERKEDREPPPELYRIGRLIRAIRKRRSQRIPKLAEEVGLTTAEWLALERGRLKVSFSTLADILDLLGIPLERVFDAKRDDFFPFIRLAMGSDPADLAAGEADEMYDFYLEVLEFRRERGNGPDASDGNTKKKGG